jgi:hypothetical protein
VTTAFLYDGVDVVRESTAGTDTAYLRTLGIDEALTRTDAVGTVHYLADALGSTVALTDAPQPVPVHRPRERRHRFVLLPGAVLRSDPQPIRQ